MEQGTYIKKYSILPKVDTLQNIYNFCNFLQSTWIIKFYLKFFIQNSTLQILGQGRGHGGPVSWRTK